MKTRKYTKKRRAEQEAETRERIVTATAELHGEVGPRHATVSAIAERAGVQRLTVYRHFPDQEALFRACTAHWLERNPPPDPGAWREIADPAERTRAALAALYAYYRDTAYMWSVSHRDRDDVPALQGPMNEFEAWLSGLRDELAEAWPGAGARTRAVLGHAVGFRAWESLAAEGLDDAAMAEAVVAWVTVLVAEDGEV